MSFVAPDRALTLLCALTFLAPQAHPQTLASLKDKNRVLLFFAANRQDPRFLEQFALLRHHAAEMHERDLVVIPILTDEAAPADPDIVRSFPTTTVSTPEQLATRGLYHVALNDFTVLLIGKDGGEKLRSRSPISPEKLNAVIDAMPMRKDEMRNPPR